MDKAECRETQDNFGCSRLSSARCLWYHEILQHINMRSAGISVVLHNLLEYGRVDQMTRGVGRHVTVCWGELEGVLMCSAAGLSCIHYHSSLWRCKNHVEGLPAACQASSTETEMLHPHIQQPLCNRRTRTCVGNLTLAMDRCGSYASLTEGGTTLLRMPDAVRTGPGLHITAKASLNAENHLRIDTADLLECIYSAHGWP